MYAHPKAIYSRRGIITAPSLANAKGYRLGEEWSNITVGANTWTATSVGTNTWTDVTVGTNTWDSVTVGTNTWTDIATDNNTWLLKG